jgi:hypothetical protein
MKVKFYINGVVTKVEFDMNACGVVKKVDFDMTDTTCGVGCQESII